MVDYKDRTSAKGDASVPAYRIILAQNTARCLNKTLPLSLFLNKPLSFLERFLNFIW